MNPWILLPLRGAHFAGLGSSFLGGLGDAFLAARLFGALLAHLAFFGGGDGFVAAVGGEG